MTRSSALGETTRVAMLCPSPGIPALAPGGASVHLRALAGGFVAAGADVRLFVRRKSRGGGVPDVAPPPGITIIEAPRGRLPGFLRKRRAWDEGVDARAMERFVAASCAAWPPDVFYERWSLYAGLGRGLSQRFRRPWILEVNAPLAWEACWFEGLEPTPSLLRREEETLRAADRVLVVSEALRDYVLRRGVERSRVVVVPNGADGSPSTRSAPSSSDPFVLGYEGTFKPWQGMVDGVPRLVELAAEVSPRRLHLALWGDGPERLEFLERVERGLRDCTVEWHGWGSPERKSWDAAWVPLGAWPPPSTELSEVFGEPPPKCYFSPLKEAAARAAGLPCWYADERGLVPPGSRPESWKTVAEQALDLVGEIEHPMAATPARRRASIFGARVS